MKKMELWAGSTLWVVISLAMMAAVFEPVELHAAIVETHSLPSLAGCMAEFAIGYETIGL